MVEISEESSVGVEYGDQTERIDVTETDEKSFWKKLKI